MLPRMWKNANIYIAGGNVKQAAPLKSFCRVSKSEILILLQESGNYPREMKTYLYAK